MLAAFFALAAAADLSLPHAREASGTSWQPDASPVEGLHAEAAGFQLMLHYAASLGWDAQLGPRGDRRVVSTNWLMGMATRELAGGQLTARTMLSLEPVTVYGAGFPELLQTGEFYQGVHLHDKQHPHNFLMEAAATYRHPLTDELGVLFYAGLSGEPALGPTAFMHRASARSDPFPPLGHHWQDSTHVTFGVLTGGFYTKQLQLEASWFNGREPDEHRWNVELRTPDSFSVRLSANPFDWLSLEVSYGYLASPEPPQFNGVVLGVSRAIASISISKGPLDLTAVWGRNLEITPLDSVLLEANLEIDGNSPFMRLEYVDKTAHDLVIPGYPTYQSWPLWSATLGYLRRLPALGPVVPWVGARASLGVVPDALAPFYGGNATFGWMVYLLIRAPRMEEHHHHHHDD